MGKRIAVFILLCCLGISWSPASPEQRLPKLEEKDLPPKYRSFLNLAAYIITAKEKDVFLQLAADRERDIFIESFWKLRDPTPGTPENEFKTEHERRFQFADKTFGRGSGRPGWQSDRGRFYIILGQAASIDRFPGNPSVYPCEVWYYYTDGQAGLPGHFGLVFFQKGGIGDYKLYDPLVDGPKSLLVPTPDIIDVPPDSYERLHEILKERAPTLADMAISLIPGEFGYGYQPSSRNTVLIADITESPKARINPSYATHFLDYKGLVTTEYMTNYVDCDGLAAVLRDPIVQADFVHFSVKPARISVDYFAPKDRYYCGFTTSVSLRTLGPSAEDVVFQYTKEFPFYFSPDDVAKIQANGVAIEDSFPVAEGQYKLIVLVQNSVAKEFSMFEQVVGLASETGRPRISGPIFGTRLLDYSANLHVPFKMMDKKLVVDPKNMYARTDVITALFPVLNADESLWRQGRARLTIRGASSKPESRKTFDLALRDFPMSGNIVMARSFAAKDFPPDYYEAEVVLLDAQAKALDTGRGQFILSPAETLGHPIANTRGFPLDNKFLFFGMLASQYARTNREEKAESYYQRAFALKPDYTKGYVDYAQFLLKSGRFDKCLEATERFKNDSAFRFEYFQLRGKALLGKEQPALALTELLEANRIYNSDIGVLNSLGWCFYKLGRKKEALDSLQASLKMNPNQAEVRKLLGEVEKNLK